MEYIHRKGVQGGSLFISIPFSWYIVCLPMWFTWRNKAQLVYQRSTMCVGREVNFRSHHPHSESIPWRDVIYVNESSREKGSKVLREWNIHPLNVVLRNKWSDTLYSIKYKTSGTFFLFVKDKTVLYQLFFSLTGSSLLVKGNILFWPFRMCFSLLSFLLPDFISFF